MLREGASAGVDGCLGRLAQHLAAVGKAPRLLGRGKGAEWRFVVTACRSACRTAWAVSSGAGLERGDPAGGIGETLRLGMELAAGRSARRGGREEVGEGLLR